jgi:hypothetical protein
LELRGTPGLGRTLALPVGCLAAAALSVGLAWTVSGPDRWLRSVSVSIGIFGGYELVRAQRLLLRQRRLADDWLRSATGVFVPPPYVWRAEQLCSPGQRRTLARMLRLIEQRAFERPVGRLSPFHLAAVREHRESVRSLARALESLEEPVTPAGMLRVLDLVTGAGSPLWGTTNDAALGDAISTTFAILTPRRLESTLAACAA